MSKSIFSVAALLSLVAGALASYALPQAASVAPQVGKIEGTVTRLGSNEPIADVQITLGAGSGAALGVRQAQNVLDAIAMGNVLVSDVLVEAAQNTVRGGGRGAQ